MVPPTCESLHGLLYYAGARTFKLLQKRKRREKEGKRGEKEGKKEGKRGEKEGKNFGWMNQLSICLPSNTSTIKEE